MSDTKTMNGVDIDQLFGTIEAIKHKAEIARFKFRASNKWVSGGHNCSTIKDFYGACEENTSRTSPFVLDADEPPVLLGEDHGANPVEFVLHALAACLTTSFIYHAAAQGVKIEELESQLEGDLDLHGFLGLSDNVRNGYENIRVTFKVKSDEPEEKLQELCELAQRRSPVFDVVTNSVPVSVKLES